MNKIEGLGGNADICEYNKTLFKVKMERDKTHFHPLSNFTSIMAEKCKRNAK